MRENSSIKYKIPPLESFTGLEVLSCNGQKSFSRHIHDGYVLWLNSSGGEDFSVNKQKATLQPGNIGIIEPGIVHENSSCDSLSRHLRSFYFSEDFLSGVFSRLEKKNMQLRTTVIENKDLWKNFIYLHNSILFQNDILKMEENILFCFSQLFNLNDPYDDKFQSQHWNDRRINTILEYFHENTDRQISLKELEELVGCSSFHIIRLFKNHTGLTAHAYLTQIRLEKAKQLLNEGKSILDTALSTGFSDQSHLTRNFITRYGLSPGEYLLKKR